MGYDYESSIGGRVEVRGLAIDLLHAFEITKDSDRRDRKESSNPGLRTEGEEPAESVGSFHSGGSNGTP